MVNLANVVFFTAFKIQRVPDLSVLCLCWHRVFKPAVTVTFVSHFTGTSMATHQGQLWPGCQLLGRMLVPGSRTLTPWLSAESEAAVHCWAGHTGTGWWQKSLCWQVIVGSEAERGRLCGYYTPELLLTPMCAQRKRLGIQRVPLSSQVPTKHLADNSPQMKENVVLPLVHISEKIEN